MSGRLRRACALVLPLLVLAAACTDDGASPNASAETTAPPPPPTAPPTTLPPGGRQPTAQDPLRVTFAGDSVMAEFAPAMIQALEGTGESVGRFILTPSVSRGATQGVVWSQELGRHRPELIVFMVGFWEDQVVGDEAYGQPGWATSYRRQVVEPFVDMVTRDGAKLLWIGMPAVRDPDATQRFVQLNSAFAGVADENPDVAFLPGGQYLSGPQGGYADVVTLPSGRLARLRRTDGLHLCPDGIVALGAPVLAAISAQWGIGAAYGWQNSSWRQPPLLHAPEECPPPV